MSAISKTADKALLVLEELRRGSSGTPAELASRLRLNRTVVQRLLTTLLQRGFVSRQRGEYALSPLIGDLAAAVRPRIREAACPHADALAEELDETVVFQVLDGTNSVVLHEARPSSHAVVQARHEIGDRRPLSMTASGLAILASLDDRTAAGRISQSTDRADITQRLEEIRRTGFSTTAGFIQSGVAGLAVAIRDGAAPLGSLAVLVPSSRASRLDDHRASLRAAVDRIERDLAASG